MARFWAGLGRPCANDVMHLSVDQTRGTIGSLGGSTPARSLGWPRLQHPSAHHDLKLEAPLAPLNIRPPNTFFESVLLSPGR